MYDTMRIVREDDTPTIDEVIEEIESEIDKEDVSGEPDSELEGTVEEDLLNPPEEDDLVGGDDAPDVEVSEDADDHPNMKVGMVGRGLRNPMIYCPNVEIPMIETEEETSQERASLVDMIDSIDTIYKCLDAQRQLIGAKTQLENVCFALGIAKDDQDFLDKKLRESEYSQEDMAEILSMPERLDTVFFTREDNSIINVTTLEGKKNQYEAKKELVGYLYSFYEMEKGIEKDLGELQEDIKKFKQEDVSSASATIANNLKQGIDDRWVEMEAMADDDPEKEEKRRMLNRLRSSYTFADMLDVLEKYPSIVNNTIKDIENPVRVKEIGQRYAAKLKQGDTFSKLYGTVRDDLDKSIERQFLHKDDYIAGKENLFAFFLIRYFSMETWTEDSSDNYTRQLHNATCIVLNNLVDGTLDTDFRDEVVGNIKKVWEKFKEVS